MKYDFGTSSVYVSLDLSLLTTAQWIAAKMNFSTDEYDYLQVKIEKTASGITAIFSGEETALQSISHTCEKPEIQIITWSNFIAVYVNENWIGNFYLPGLYYPNVPEVMFKGTVGLDVPIVKYQLTDWKEAFYLEMDTGISNGISSAVGQRMIISRNMPDGSMQMFYPQESRTPVPVAKVLSHKVRHSAPKAFSDNVTYATNVDTFTDLDVLKRFGFRTGIHRLPDLDAGALRAAAQANTISAQSHEKHEISVQGFDPAIEIDDEVAFAGKAFIVEDISFTMKAGDRPENSCKIMGRGL